MKNKGTCVLFSNKEKKINRQGERNTRLYIKYLIYITKNIHIKFFFKLVFITNFHSYHIH